jgi:hypothetical protein
MTHEEIEGYRKGNIRDVYLGITGPGIFFDELCLIMTGFENL